MPLSNSWLVEVPEPIVIRHRIRLPSRPRVEQTRARGRLRQWPALALLIAASWLFPAEAVEAQGAQGKVGIRITTSNVDAEMLSADFDLTMYTRGYGPMGTAGRPTYYADLPALDYGDGSTIPTLTLAFASSVPTTGVIGTTTVYRSLASLSHTYPAPDDYVATAGMACVACFRSSYVFFPPGSPPPETFTAEFDRLPDPLIGNLVAPNRTEGTAYITALGTSVRFLATYFPGVSNTATLPFGQVVLEVPTASQWGLGAFGALLLALGLGLVGRTR